MIRTKRLILRPWQEEDFEAFAQMNADPRVMEFFPSTLTKQESDQLAKRLQDRNVWAVSVPGESDFIGFIGLNSVNFPVHFVPAVEIGWRLAFDFWGKGYATEGAVACLQYGFKNLNLNEIVSFTAVQNLRSRAVMEKIGMHRDPKDDFDHPMIPEGHRLKRHVLYRIQKNELGLLHKF